jgi:broad specificity phosphatase PhoE
VSTQPDTPPIPANRVRRDPTGKTFASFRNPAPNTTTELLLVRHGQTAANVDGLLVGRQDVVLTMVGHQQAARVGRAVRDLDPEAIVSSPLLRTRQTAAAIGEQAMLMPEIEEDIAEFSFGDFEGWSERDALARHPHLRALIQGEAHADETWPNGESGTTFIARIFAGLGRIVSAHPNRRVVVVTHGGVIGSFVSRMESETATSFFPYLVGNCSISTFAVSSDGTRCVAWNQRDHLEGLLGHER